MTEKKKKILFAIGSLAVGGSESQLLMLASSLVEHGYEVYVYCLEGGPLYKKMQQAGVIVAKGIYNSRAYKLIKPTYFLSCFFQMLWLTLWLRPDVIHVFLPLTNFMAAIIGKFAGIKLIITSKRGLSTHCERYSWWNYFERLANHLSDIITVNSLAVRNDTLQRDNISITKLRLIYNGVNFSDTEPANSKPSAIRESLGITPDDIALIYTANLITYKGHADLIQAMALIHQDHPRAHLFLAGEDRGIQSSLISLSQKLGVENNIHFMGRRSDIPQLLRIMDIGVMASHEEGFSNALLEKLAAGLPVVATNIGGNPEALANLSNCLLVESHNPVAMAKALAEIIRGLSMAKANASLRIQNITQRYNVRTMVNQYAELYKTKKQP